MKRGFTLVELLGVIVILGIIAVIAFPSIINQITDARNNIEENTNTLIFDAAESYFEDYANLDSTSSGKYYCVTLETLVDEGLLNEPIKNAQTGKKYDVTKTSVRLKYAGKHQFTDGRIGATTTLTCIKVGVGS